MSGHGLADVVPCGPGELAIQWHCECGAWGKPVSVTRPASHHQTAGTKALAGHRRHALRAKQPDDPAHSQSSGSGVHAANKFPAKDDQDAVSRPPVAPAPLPE